MALSFGRFVDVSKRLTTVARALSAMIQLQHWLILTLICLLSQKGPPLSNYSNHQSTTLNQLASNGFLNPRPRLSEVHFFVFN